jgi:hypothetical protein
VVWCFVVFLCSGCLKLQVELFKIAGIEEFLIFVVIEVSIAVVVFLICSNYYLNSNCKNAQYFLRFWHGL